MYINVKGQDLYFLHNTRVNGKRFYIKKQNNGPKWGLIVEVDYCGIDFSILMYKRLAYKEIKAILTQFRSVDNHMIYLSDWVSNIEGGALYNEFFGI